MNLKLLYLFAILSGILLGYHLGIIGPALPILKAQYGFNVWELAHIVSSFLIGLIAGSLISSQLTDRIGRKKALLLWAFIFCVSSLIGYQAKTFLSLLTYRFLSGIAAGMIGATVPLVMVENAQVEQRGKLTCVFQIFIASGVGISSLAGYLFLDSQNVRSMFLFPIIFSSIAIVLFSRYILVLTRNLKMGLHLKTYKKSYLVALGLNFFQQAVGINAVTFFAQSFLSTYHTGNVKTAYSLVLIMNALSVLGTVLSFLLIRRFGRTFFLKKGALGMAFGMGMLAFSKISPLLAVLGLSVFIFSFGFSFGPMVYLVMGEVFPDFLRAHGVGFAFLCNSLTNYIVSLTFLSAEKAFGISSIWTFFAGVCLAAWAFVRYKVPETKDKSIDTIIKEMN